MPMSALEHGDRVAFFECDDRLLPRRATARPARRETARTAPGAHHQGAHVGHGDLEQRLDRRADLRSEEHTSELQSHSDLVCRLLLEKKKEVNSWQDAFAIFSLIKSLHL